MNRLLACSGGTMALTLSQLFMGSITIGIASFRGTEAYLSFHYEALAGHANYAASTLGAGHARSANAVADDNVISAAIMGPRFAVEADNITMDVDALIACPQTNNAYMQKICAEYHANKPRALAKLAWVRAKQALLWGTLGQLSGDIDRATNVASMETIRASVGGLDAQVSIRSVDPSESGSIWGGDNTAVACTLAENDALGSPMPGSAFPVLMENLMQGLPQVLVQILPRVLCAAESAASGGGSEKVVLPQIPSVAKATQADCARLEQEMQCQASGECGALVESPVNGVSRTPTFSSDVAPYVSCSVLSPSAGPRLAVRGGYTVRSGGQLTTCTFDAPQCTNDRLAANSAAFLQSVGLPSTPGGAGLGGATHAPSDDDWNHSDSFRACTFATKPIDDGVANVSDAVRTLVSFGAAARTTTLREQYEVQSCAKWYFPDGSDSPFAATAHEQQPFVAAWKFALVAPRGGAP